jgi:hypothetical protein
MLDVASIRKAMKAIKTDIIKVIFLPHFSRKNPANKAPAIAPNGGELTEMKIVKKHYIT